MSIIKQLEGFIDVYSEEGLGSTFNLYIPLLERDSLGGREEDGAAIYHGEGTILVIDDDVVLRETAYAILVSAGYTVLTASDGAAGVKLYGENKEKIKAVVLDLVMPNMSGREAYVELRAINKQIKVLLVSGFRKDARVEEVLGLGADSFLQKPYTIASLTKALRDLLVTEQKEG